MFPVASHDLAGIWTGRLPCCQPSSIGSPGRESGRSARMGAMAGGVIPLRREGLHLTVAAPDAALVSGSADGRASPGVAMLSEL